MIPDHQHPIGVHCHCDGSLEQCLVFIGADWLLLLGDNAVTE